MISSHHQELTLFGVFNPYGLHPGEGSGHLRFTENHLELGGICPTSWLDDCPLPTDTKGKWPDPLERAPRSPAQNPAGWLAGEEVTVGCAITSTAAEKREISRKE